jgi:hypothetical protein
MDERQELTELAESPTCSCDLQTEASLVDLELLQSHNICFSKYSNLEYYLKTDEDRQTDPGERMITTDRSCAFFPPLTYKRGPFQRVPKSVTQKCYHEGYLDTQGNQ